MKEGGREINLEGLLGSGEGPFEAGACDFVAISVCTVFWSLYRSLKREKVERPSFLDKGDVSLFEKPLVRFAVRLLAWDPDLVLPLRSFAVWGKSLYLCRPQVTLL